MTDLQPIGDMFAEQLQEMAHDADAEPGDYRNDDGILCCGKCHEPKEVEIELLSQRMVVACMCRCESERYEARERRFIEDQRRIRAERLRIQGINDDSLRHVRFAGAQQTVYIQKCKEFCDHWDEIKRENMGLLLYGSKGNGKTYCAACIANELIDRGVPVLMTSFPAILNTGQKGMNELVRQAQEYDLIIVDDLGAERDTEYALETVYYFVDARYRTGKPMIITTNLEMDELRNPHDLKYARIYDRVLEMCIPMGFSGESRRVAKRKDKAALLRQIINGTGGGT